jgi:two-component SAPR family response regulator
MKKDELNQSCTLTISLFGELAITNGDRRITESSNRSRKLWNMLAFIIANRKKSITQSEFISTFWPDEDSLNPENALKTLLYRIRLLLKPVDTNNSELIISSRSSYRWNNDLPCVIDVELFEDLLNNATDPSLGTQRRISLYIEAINLYKGSFLSNHSSEFWVFPLSTHYHSLYLDAVKSLAFLFEAEEMYEEMAMYCTKAIHIDPLDESLHALLIRSLLKQGNNNVALKHYGVATELLYRNLGVKPSNELLSLYQQLMKIQKGLETDLAVIHNQLKEADYVIGAFVCDYGFFQEAYRLEARQATRENRPLFLCLITITLSNGELPELDVLDLAMNRLLDAITSCLRKGDIVSKYSGAQYVILLPTADYDVCNMIMERIVSTYYKENRKSLLRIQFKLEQLCLPKGLERL